MTAKNSIAATAIASMRTEKNATENRDKLKIEGMPVRKQLINEVFKVAKADHKLKAQTFVFYMTEIIGKGATLETTLPFFKQEINLMFENGELKATDIDENTDECVNADVVYNNLRKMFSQAKARHERATNPKGTDERNDEIKAKAFFDNTKLSDIAEGFTMLKPERKDRIIRALFLQMDVTERHAILLELDAMKDQPIPEIDDIK